MSPVNAALAGVLAKFPAHVLQVVSSAAGTSAVDPPLSGVDVLGFYATATPAIECWMVTAGRLVRVEVTGVAALVVTFPLERVSRVSELYAADGYTLTIEVDSEARTRIGDTRDQFTSYIVVARDPGSMADLVEFSRQLRLCMGI